MGDRWSGLGQPGEVADFVYIQLPLDPSAYADNGEVDQIIKWAIRQIDRQKLSTIVNADAVDGLGESFVSLPNEQAMVNFGEMQFVQGAEEVETETAVEVALSGTASPLEWDGASRTYKYSYDNSGQTHHVWLGHEAAMHHRARLADQYGLRGVALRGLGHVTNGAGYAAALESLKTGGEAPQPSDAAIVWTVRDEGENVLSSATGGDLTFAWDGSELPGNYTINADFALGDSVTALDSQSVMVAGCGRG